MKLNEKERNGKNKKKNFVLQWAPYSVACYTVPVLNPKTHVSVVYQDLRLLTFLISYPTLSDFQTRFVLALIYT